MTVRALMEIEAILFRPEDPFVFTSGRASPVYVDCRRIIAFPRVRATLMTMAVNKLFRDAGLEAFDVVAGGETAGIPFAAWLAERLGLPMAYIRKKPKGFGRNARIEGVIEPGDRVLLVEDLASDGGSKLGFIDAIKEAEAKVAHAFVIFSYGIFPEALARVSERGVTLHALATWWDALAVAKQQGYLSAEGLREVEAFLKAPDDWSAAHGGKTTADLQ